MQSTYADFIASKSRHCDLDGFKPNWLPDFLFDFQSFLCDWSIRIGRGLTAADCGLGKTPMQLVFAENVVRHTNRPVMLATPLAVGAQTLREAEKFGIAAKRTRNGKMTDEACVWVTNYQQLHKYDASRFAGFVGDEASACKDFKSDTKAVVNEFARKVPFRGLFTATAAPNDFWELGNLSEILGRLGFRDMITTFFKQETSKDDRGWGRTKYRFRGHAEEPFWSWVCSWARSLRRPSDIGFDDSRFVLPELIETEYVCDTANPRNGFLFTVAARDMREERAERRHSIEERCAKACELATSADGCSVTWCELNDEGDMMKRMLPNSVQVSGADSDESKEEKLQGFSDGSIQRLIIKPKVGAWGLNWQHCHNVNVFPSHSFEQYYQLVRRCYRFGQKEKVKVNLIVCEGERGIMKSLRRKQHQSDVMFNSIVSHMKDSMHLVSKDYFPEREKVPSWL